MTAQQSRAPLLSRHLLDGYQDFLAGRFQRERQKFQDLAERGQHPHTLVIGCCDSRVTPEEIFNAEPGEIFDVRNVANLVPPCASNNYHHGSWAAIDYAVSHLGVSDIIVLGHASCGGVRAFVERQGQSTAPQPPAQDDYIADWIATIAPAAARLGPAPAIFDPGYADRLARESVKQGLANLRNFEKIVEAERTERLKLHGAFFRIEDASLWTLDEAADEFVQISPDAHRASLAAPRF